MTTRVFLLRHGESALPNVFHGAESDIGLSVRGQRQAELAAQFLTGRQPQAVVSSAMRRARETAWPIARACGLELHQAPELHERRVGILSGQPFDAYEHMWPQTLERWLAGETGYASAGAESFADLQARLLPAWERLIQPYRDQTLVIVAHGVVIKVLLVSLLEGYSLRDWKTLGPIHNVGVTEMVQASGVWRADRLNEKPPGVAELE